MRTSIKLTILLIFTAVASIEIAAQQKSDLVGSYTFRFEWGGTELVLKSNGTYRATIGRCTALTTNSGSYSVSNNVVRFTTLKLTMRSYGEKKEHDLTKRKVRKRLLDTDEPFTPEIWELQIVRWDERIYLMKRELFDSFIAAMNFGFEPRSVDGYRAFYGEVYLRDGDEKKRVSGPPPLPEEFLRDLLPEPVVATVLDITPDGPLQVATIDRGSADGLKASMSLAPIIPTPFFEPLPIHSVAEHSAQVQVYGDVKVGDKLSTRVADVLRYAE